MRRGVALALVFCVGAGVCFYLWFRNRGDQPQVGAGPVQDAASVSPTVQKVAAPRMAVPPTNEAASAPLPGAVPELPKPRIAAIPTNWPKAGPLGLPPDIVLRNARAAVTQYGSMFKGNPVGTNPEITAALNGNNPKQVKFISPESGLQINDKGEMVDPWGTPFFFHQLSARDMEVRSAGPDKVMWTGDDLVTH